MPSLSGGTLFVAAASTIVDTGTVTAASVAVIGTIGNDPSVVLRCLDSSQFDLGPSVTWTKSYGRIHLANAA